MSDIWGTIKGVIGIVAPSIASVMGTPVAGIAVKGLCDILGLNSNATPTEIEKAFAKATPEQLLRLKELEATTKLELKKLDIDQEKIDQMERASAREREVKLAESGNRDYIPALLATTFVLGFFGLLAILIFYHNMSTSSKGILEIMIGVLGAGITQILGYYFGSSRSSREKTKLLIGNQ